MPFLFKGNPAEFIIFMLVRSYSSDHLNSDMGDKKMKAEWGKEKNIRDDYKPLKIAHKK